MEYLPVDLVNQLKELIVTCDAELGDSPLRRVTFTLSREDTEYEYEFIYAEDDGWSVVV